MTEPLSTPTRAARLAQLESTPRFDLLVIGGGATGLGTALDAAARGLRVALIEARDFAQGTSSRATKLVHGGVRYLAQGNIALVREALHERTRLLAHAPHLAQPLPFVMPAYRWWEPGFYGAGLKLYDLLAGSAGLGATEILGAARVRQHVPGVRADGLVGGVRYWDGQFDDARLALALARTAQAQGAQVLNHLAATALLHEGGRVVGVRARDAETGRELDLRAGCVINATGVWVDELRAQDSRAAGRSARSMVAPSQGVHLVVDREFLPGDHALLVPRTADGRVLFAVPWLGKTILGTTDTPRDDLALEPTPFADEVRFILGESARYLARAPQPADVRSVWVGLRPLVRPQGDDGDGENTKALSREHTVLVARSGLVTVTGGKWTTYRAMAEDVLDRCMDAGLLPRSPAGRTRELPLVGAQRTGVPISAAPGPHLWGSEAAALAELPGAGRELAAGLTEAMVRFAARAEQARCTEDVLARRWRLLFLDAAAAEAAAPAVAQVLAEETGVDPKLDAFVALCRRYRSLP